MIFDMGHLAAAVSDTRQFVLACQRNGVTFEEFANHATASAFMLAVTRYAQGKSAKDAVREARETFPGTWKAQ